MAPTKMTVAELELKIARLEAQAARDAEALAAAQAKKGGKAAISVKVSAKGAVSIYGMGRFPFTFYKEQLLKILDMDKELRAFMVENDAKLGTKDNPITHPELAKPFVAKVAPVAEVAV